MDAGESGGRVSTIDMRVDYLAPGRLEPLIAGRGPAKAAKVAVVDVPRLSSDYARAVYADGRVVYSIRPVRTSPTVPPTRRGDPVGPARTDLVTLPAWLARRSNGIPAGAWERHRR